MQTGLNFGFEQWSTHGYAALRGGNHEEKAKYLSLQKPLSFNATNNATLL